MPISELDYQVTELGPLILRRRTEPLLGNVDVYEVLLGDEYLMSSLFVAGEEALAELGLARCAGDRLDVVVGGLGLGYTANKVLADERVRSLLVIDALEPVIRWHREGLVPLGHSIRSDPRCRLLHGDFFALAASREGFDPDEPSRRFDAILVDIDHAPDNTLHDSNVAFYSTDGLTRLARHLKPGGVFGLWSNDPPDADFVALLASVFDAAEAREVAFDNPYQGGEAKNTIYLGTRPI
ncbi:MAG: spermidine synthase [Candidatus Dadabacteria bacterium]|nr:MAG: spermidine synthase [Candidatus Dadabacteria bacterium]